MTDAYTLTIALGGKWAGGRGIACCPAHDDRSPSLSLADGCEGWLLLRCHAGCSFAEVTDALHGRGLIAGTGTFRPFAHVIDEERRAAERAFREKRTRQARRLWNAARPIAGTPAELYLRGRGITCPLPRTLRYVGDCWHQSAKLSPALVSHVHNVGDRDSFAVHRTYVRGDGLGKADLLPNKAMLGPVSGGAVSLSNIRGPLVVTEGIETGLSLLSGILGKPMTVWAALSAGGMVGLTLPETPGELIIAPDGDPTGREAADALATRAHGLGWNVSMLPAPNGFDWNDVLTGKAVAA
ncbi:MAG: DUF7146 domain-containing protein [Yoonia sp.]|uniref:DUF7146 domain-containing protein n=1 Tax=Yoonia sp. TaxID=2212373 RepID=UPI003EF26110